MQAEKQLPAHGAAAHRRRDLCGLCSRGAGGLRALKKFARRVALGIIGLQSVLDVERVAIGGGISAADALLPGHPDGAG